jgi:hypothetical protein
MTSLTGAYWLHRLTIETSTTPENNICTESFTKGKDFRRWDESLWHKTARKVKIPIYTIVGQ